MPVWSWHAAQRPPRRAAGQGLEEIIGSKQSGIGSA